MIAAPPPVEERSIVMSMSVCLSVCLSVGRWSARISLKPHDRASLNFLCVLAVGVARSSSGSVAICYVLPDMWMPSYLCVITRNIGDAIKAYTHSDSSGGSMGLAPRRIPELTHRGQ